EPRAGATGARATACPGVAATGTRAGRLAASRARGAVSPLGGDAASGCAGATVARARRDELGAGAADRGPDRNAREAQRRAALAAGIAAAPRRGAFPARRARS